MSQAGLDLRSWTRAKMQKFPQISLAEIWLQYLEYDREWRANGGKGLRHTKSDFAAAMEVERERQQNERLTALRGGLSHQEDREDHVGDLLEAWTGSRADEVSRAVLRQWLWQVKRNLFERPDSYHLMLVLRGGQGRGKSTAIERLLAPLGALATHMNVDEITGDGRFKSALAGHVAVVFDELSGARRARLDQLRKLISNRRESYRPMGVNGTVEMTNRASFIGSTNPPLTEQLGDPTGMRRFYEFDCDLLSQERVNRVDYAALWRSVDENIEQAPIIEHLGALADKQADLLPTDPFNDFVLEYELSPGHARVCLIRDAFAVWKDWATQHGEQAHSATWLMRKFKNSRYTWQSQKRIPGKPGQYTVVFLGERSKLGVPVVSTLRAMAAD